jgi:hypothetical protein
MPNGRARIEQPVSASKMSVHVDRATADRFRRYCLKYGVTFSYLAVTAILHFVENCPPLKPQTLRLPTGRRLRPRQ